MLGNPAAERKFIESTYEDFCDIYEKTKYKDPSTGETKLSEVTTHRGLKCALSKAVGKPAEQTDAQANIGYEVRLFLQPDIVVKPGSKIVVTRNGIYITFHSSGESFIYPTHQEIILKREDYA